MSDEERSAKDRTRNMKEKRNDKRTKPALVLFGNDVSAEDIVAAIKAESKRQLETGDIGRSMLRIERNSAAAKPATK